MRQVHDIEVRDQPVHNLISLLLAVAGILTHDHVRGLDIRTDLAQLEPECRFNKRAGVSGEDLLNRFRGKIGSCTETYQGGVCGSNDLFRNKDAERPDDFPTLFLFVHQLFDSKPVHFAQYEVEIVHGLGSIALAEIDILICFAQNAQKGIMGLEIQAEVFPHLFVRGAHCISPFVSLRILTHRSQE